MKRIPVIFNDHRYKRVSGVELDQLLVNGSVKAFRRSSGWAIIGQDSLRGDGGIYSGPDRRREFKRLCALGSRSCLTCNNFVAGKCVRKEFVQQ